MPIIHWFRRDFRLYDNTALWHAAGDAPDGIIPVFIFDDDILRHPDTGGPIVQFMLECLAELRDSLRRAGGDLILRHGRPDEELLELARAGHASAVYFNKDYAPGAIERDARVQRLLESEGIAVRAFKDQVIFEEREVLAESSGRPFIVFGPYRRAWQKRFDEIAADGGPRVAPRPRLRFPAALRTLRSIDLPHAADLGFNVAQTFEIAAGEQAARRMLRQFCAGPIRRYAQMRNLPAIVDGTSRLSPHLRHGTISPRQCIAAALEARREGGAAFREGVDGWLAELIWREFFQQILFNFPRVEHEPFRANWHRLKFPSDERAFERWWRGTSGVPIVDAAMRQLNATGWMHNRLRMIVAMFLTKDLLLDYRLGERYFMRNLIDGETAQNNGNWQWSAGCGTDAQPWFRIFNPVAQARRFDPDGAFVRRWCPELARVPVEFIHEPHLMSADAQRTARCRIPGDYPAPMVDHGQARRRALEFFGSLRRSAQSQRPPESTDGLR